jgi:hypothetical protein
VRTCQVYGDTQNLPFLVITSPQSSYLLKSNGLSKPTPHIKQNESQEPIGCLIIEAVIKKNLYKIYTSFLVRDHDAEIESAIDRILT